MIRYAVLLCSIFLSTVAFSQSYTYTYVDPCTKLIKSITIPSGQQNIAVTYYGQVGTFSQADFNNGNFIAWMNSTSAINSNKPCDGLVTTTTTQTNLIVTNNIISTLTNITSVATMSAQLAGSVASVSTGGVSNALGNATNNSSSNSSGNSEGGSNNQSNNSGGNNGSGNSSGSGSTAGGSNGGSAGSGNTGGSGNSGGTSGGSGNGGGNTGGSGSGGGNTGGSGGSGGNTGGSGGSGGNTGGGSTGNPGQTGGTNPPTNNNGGEVTSSSGGNGGTTNSVSNAAEASAGSDGGSGGSGGGSGSKSGDKNRARVGSLIGTGDLVAIRSAEESEKDQFKFTMSMTHSNTKNTFAKGFLGNFTTSINNSNITFYGAWTKKTATLIAANSSMINFDKDLFNTSTVLGSKRYGKLSLMGGANFTVGKLGKTAFTNLSAVGGGFYLFTPGKSKKITGTLLLLGVYSPFTQFYEGRWWDSGILLVPFSSWDYSITKKFKFNISFSGTYEWNKNMLNYQVLTGGKILL